MGQSSENIEKYFSKLDLDGDKSLTTQELAPFIRSRCQDLTDAQLQTLINSFDKNSMLILFLQTYYGLFFFTRDKIIESLNTLHSNHLR